jgi:hypothetical protein
VFLDAWADQACGVIDDPIGLVIAPTRSDEARHGRFGDRRHAGDRGVAAASLIAQAGVGVFNVAFERWVDPAGAAISSSRSASRSASCK